MAPKVWAGTSGFSYPKWRGAFYPEKLATGDMLKFYAGQLPAVEINNTFYRMPSESLIARWAAETPDHFRFALKAPKRISHVNRLQDCGEAIARFETVTRPLGVRRGPALVQLPPYFKCSPERLRGFLADWRTNAEGFPIAFEFRHDSWADDEIYAQLRAAGAALCLADPGLSKGRDLPPPTTSWSYLRLRAETYTPDELSEWARHVRRAELTHTHVFFKHEDAGRSPQMARTFLATLDDQESDTKERDRNHM